MIDLDLARSISKPFTQSAPVPDLGFDLQAMADESLEVLTDYTGLTTARVPAAEIITRDEWVEMNLLSMAGVFELVDKQLDSKVNDRAKTKNFSPVVEMLMKAASGLLVSTEVGVLYSFMSQRVLGQVEASLFMPGDDIRLVFVGQNLAGATKNMDVDARQFYHWVVLHELTHVYQFAGVPWLRDHLSGLMKTYLTSVEANLDTGKLGKLPDVEQIQQALKGGGLAALLQSPAQREQMEQIQAVMALIEGYAEHVMDAAGERILGDYRQLRTAMQSRRKSRSQLEQMVLKLLGLEMKMRQYEDGRAFCNGVAENFGIEVLNLVWAQAENIPTGAEVADFELWVKRVAPNTPRSERPVAPEPTPSSTIEQQVNAIVPLSSEGKEKLRDLEDEEYLRALIKGDPSPQYLVEMAAWLKQAEALGYIIRDVEAWIVTAEGRSRLVEILSK